MPLLWPSKRGKYRERRRRRRKKKRRKSESENRNEHEKREELLKGEREIAKWRESTISKEPEKISATGGRNKSAKVFSFLTSVGSCFCVACAQAYLRTLCSSRDSRG